MRLRMLVAATAMTWSFACGGSSTLNDGGTTDTGIADGGITDGGDPMVACTVEATARCTKLDACSNGTAVSRAYGTMTTCVHALVASCLTALAATPTTATPAFEVACADAYTAQSCTDFRNGVAPDACVPPAGPLANGMPCLFNAQCQSTICLTPRNGLCGSCATQPTDGADCSATTGCGRNMVCNHNASAGTYTCRVPVQTGAACDLDHPCAADLACVVATMGAPSGACQPLGNAPGAACNAFNVGTAGCTGNFGLFCNGMHMCALATVGAVGDTCGVTMGRASDVVCGGGASCSYAMTGTTLTCVAPVADGQPCDAINGPPCTPPARCVLTNPVGADGGTGGTCRAPMPTSCP